MSTLDNPTGLPSAGECYDAIQAYFRAHPEEYAKLYLHRSTCDTCRFWEEDPIGLGAGACENPKLNSISYGEDEVHHAGENTPAITGPKFGCIHHSPIDPEPESP